MIKTIVFDYDGTLHNLKKIYCRAFYEVQNYFVKMGYIQYKKYTPNQITKWLGLTAKEMWDDFAPNISDELKQLGSSMIGDRMNELIDDAELYEGSINLLSKLKGKANLIFLSNCKRSYMLKHIEKFNLDDHFNGFYCAEDYDYKPKYKIFEQIKSRYEGEYIVIGDRYKDMETKEHHDVITIGCLYGYGDGELEAADYLAKSVWELEDVVLDLLSVNLREN